MKKVVLLFLFFVFSKSLFSQWVVQNFDDGFDKSTLIRTDIYEHINEYGCKSYLTFSKGFGLYPSLYFISNCSTGEKNRRWAIKILLTVGGVEKEYNALDYGGYSYKKVFTYNNSCLDLRLDKESLEDFLNATYVKIRATNSAYDPIYFQMKLNPVNTQEAWNLETGGKYFEEKKEEQNRIKIENENIEADKKVLIKINDLISKNILESAVIEYSNLKLKYPELREQFQLALINQYKDSVVTLSQDQIRIYIQEYINQIKLREIEVKRENEIRNRNFQVVKNGLIKIKPGIYNVKFDISGNPNNKELNLNSDVGEYFNDLDFEIEKNIGEFKVRLNSTAQFTIENKDSILINTVFYSSGNKQIVCYKNEKFYFKTKNSLPVATIKYDEEVPLKTVKIEKTFKSEKYVNGILIDSTVFKTEKIVEIQKKD